MNDYDSAMRDLRGHNAVALGVSLLVNSRVVQYTRTVTVRELRLRSVTVRKEVCTVRKTFPTVTFF